MATEKRYTKDQLKKMDNRRLTHLYSQWMEQEFDVGEFPRSGLIDSIIEMQAIADHDEEKAAAEIEAEEAVKIESETARESTFDDVIDEQDGESISVITGEVVGPAKATSADYHYVVSQTGTTPREHIISVIVEVLKDSETPIDFNAVKSMIDLHFNNKEDRVSQICWSWYFWMTARQIKQLINSITRLSK